MIADMSDQEKSVLLAKAMGVVGEGREAYTYAGNGIWECDPLYTNLYDPANMAQAWRVHLWMLDRELGKRESPYNVSPKPYTRWWNGGVPWMKLDAQHLWLDKILALAIEAVLIEVSNE